MTRSLLALFVVGCSVTAPGSESISSVVPSSGPTTEDTPVRVQGTFHLPFATDLDHGTTSVGSVSATVGTTPLLDLVWRSDELIEGTVPSGLPLGAYDVTVAVGGSTSTLPGAFTVTAEPLPAAPWSAPTVIPELSSPYSDDDPSMTADRLELFFNSDRPGGVGGPDIWVSTRASTTDPWGTPALVPGVNSPTYDSTPKISADGLTLYFSSDRPGGINTTNFDNWVTTRPDRASAWSTPVVVAELNTAANDSCANPNASQLSLVQSSTRDGTSDIFLSTRASVTDPWGTPMSLPEINSPTGDSDPCLAKGDRVIVFVSDRPGGSGFDDIFIATRLPGAAQFDPPQPVVELNTAAEEQDPWITDDLHYIMFTSNLTGDLEIYEASR